MSAKMKPVSCEQANLLDLVDYLSALGYHPSRISRDDYWYCSPLRDEKTASFKINRRKNVWFDHGTGQGGNMVDFGLLYHQCSVKELLEKLNNTNPSFHQPSLKDSAVKESAIKIVAERRISSLSLSRYLKQRRIAEDVAQKYCKEVSFSLHNKIYSAIGFRNDSGGFELRNQWYKGSCSPKTITTIENGTKELSVFEGFFDFLSYCSIARNQKFPETSFLILNSTAFFEKSRPVMEQYPGINLFLDRDATGMSLTAQALGWNKKYRDESHLYNGYKDLNEWTQQIGKSMKKGLKP